MVTRTAYLYIPMIIKAPAPPSPPSIPLKNNGFGFDKWVAYTVQILFIQKTKKWRSVKFDRFILLFFNKNNFYR